MPRAKLRTPELRERVLQAAVDTLASDGVAGFTTRRIALEAETSTPAVYELFGDKAGLVREVFFEGFRLLHRRFAALPQPASPRAGVVAVMEVFRVFVRDNPILAELMFSRPFADFDPGPAELAAGAAVREVIVGRARRAVEAGLFSGDPTDIAHVLFCMAQGLAAAEVTGRLGTSAASVDRRWALALGAVIHGLSAPAPA